MKLLQYQLISKIEKEESNETIKTIKQKAILLNRKYEELIEMDYTAMLELLSTVDTSLQYSSIVDTFTCESETFKLINEPDDINFLQYTDAEKYLSEGLYVKFFTVFTFTKEQYKHSAWLVDEFDRREKLFENVDASVWFPFMDNIVKKKEHSILSIKRSLLTPQLVNHLQTDFIKNILTFMESVRLYLNMQRQSKSMITYYTEILCLRVITFLLKRMKPELTIRLLSKILTRNSIRDMFSRVG